MTALYPLYHKLENRPVVVIGGGPDPPPTNVSYSNLNAVGVTFVHADTNEVTSVAGAKQMAALCRANNLSCALPLLSLLPI